MASVLEHCVSYLITPVVCTGVGLLAFVDYIGGCICFDRARKVWEYKGKSRFVCEF